LRAAAILLNKKIRAKTKWVNETASLLVEGMHSGARKRAFFSKEAHPATFAFSNDGTQPPRGVGRASFEKRARI